MDMKNNVGTVKIRTAVRSDMPDVYKMILELAVFEEMPDGPKIKADILERDAFDISPPLFKCYMAEVTDANNTPSPIGYALFFNTYSTWEGKSLMLEDIFVKPNCRKMGVGKKMFQAIAKYALDTDCCRVDFHVLKWNPARTMYELIGATNLTESEDWLFYRLGQDALRNLYKEGQLCEDTMPEIVRKNCEKESQ